MGGHANRRELKCGANQWEPAGSLPAGRTDGRLVKQEGVDERVLTKGWREQMGGTNEGADKKAANEQSNTQLDEQWAGERRGSSTETTIHLHTYRHVRTNQTLLVLLTECIRCHFCAAPVTTTMECVV